MLSPFLTPPKALCIICHRTVHRSSEMYRLLEGAREPFLWTEKKLLPVKLALSHARIKKKTG